MIFTVLVLVFEFDQSLNGIRLPQYGVVFDFHKNIPGDWYETSALPFLFLWALV